MPPVAVSDVEAPEQITDVGVVTDTDVRGLIVSVSVLISIHPAEVVDECVYTPLMV